MPKHSIVFFAKLVFCALVLTMVAVIYICAAAAPCKNYALEAPAPETSTYRAEELAPSPGCGEHLTEAVADSEASLEAETVVEISLETEPPLYPELCYVAYYDVAMTEELLIAVRVAINELSSVDRTLYTYEAISAIAIELTRLQELEARLVSDVRCYLKWENEHYYAAKVWEFFKQRGFSDAVTCAIIGNMMIETSGGSLDLNPTIYSPSKNYYGLCQWSRKYYPETKNLSFEQQLTYLVDSMPKEFKTFGHIYAANFDYKAFLSMASPEEAARAFAMVYERCGSASYKMRQEAALKAYNYFNLERP